MRNGACSQRQEWGRHTFGSDCSSWPAVTTGAAKECTYTDDQHDKSKPRIALAGAAKAWATPNAHDGRRPGADMKSTQGANLSRQAPEIPPDGPLSSPLAPTLSQRYQSPRAGKKGVPGQSARHRGQPKGKRLNPRFVEWLMGFPPGWTDSDAAVTPSFQSWLRSHSELLRSVLGSPSRLS